MCYKIAVGVMLTRQGQLGLDVQEYNIPNVGKHVGILCPCLGKAEVTQLEHWRITVVQQCVVKLQVPADQV